MLRRIDHEVSATGDSTDAVPEAVNSRIAAAAILAVTAMIAPDRAWANLSARQFFLVTVGLGGALFIALTNVCGARWSVAFRRVPEAMTGLLLPGGALLLLALWRT